MKDLIKISSKFQVKVDKKCDAIPRKIYLVKFIGWFAHEVMGNLYTVLQFEVIKGVLKNKRFVFHANTKIVFCNNRFHQTSLCKAVIALINHDPKNNEIINLDELKGSVCLALIDTDSTNKTYINQLFPIKYKKLVKRFDF